MSQPYQIKQPIYNRQTLRQEKRRLRLHIRRQDSEMTQQINNLPVIGMVRTVKEVGNLFSKNLRHSSFASLLSMGKNPTSFWQELAKATAIFVGTKLVKKWMNKEEDDPNAQDDAVGLND